MASYAAVRREKENTGEDTDRTQDQTRCGIGPCKPAWAERLANPKLFVLNASLIFSVVVMTGTYFGGVLSTLERTFQISSSTSGGIVIIQNVVEVVVVLLVGYFGHGSHRPRWIATGVLLNGFAALLFTIPHYVTEPMDASSVLAPGTSDGYNAGQNPNDLCQITTNSTMTGSMTTSTSMDDCSATNGDDHDGIGPIIWIVIGRILTGLGSAPLYPLILSYLDDGVDKHDLPLYTACLFMLIAFGPAIGFFISSLTLAMYVDFDRIPSDEIPDIPQNDPRYIGAWWLGFFVCGTLLIALAVPMFLFPKRLRPRRENETLDESVDDGLTMKRGGNDTSSCDDVRKEVCKLPDGLLKALRRQVTNVPLIFTCLGSSVENATLIVLGNFLTKTIQEQFGVSPSLAGTLFGGVILPSTLISQVISGFICKKLKLNARGCTIYILICNICIAIATPIIMFTGCQNPAMAGVSVSYAETNSSRYGLDLQTTCNAECACPSEIQFNPVCGTDGVTYVSPCHAGCINTTMQFDEEDLSENKSQYLACSCIVHTIDDIPAGSAVSGRCIDECQANSVNLIIFLLLIFFCILMGGMISNPYIYVIMRVVHEDDRSVAMAVNSFTRQIFGAIPSPLYFGAIINSTCILWQYTCGDRGACWVYDIVKYRFAFFGTMLALRLLYIVCNCVVIGSLKREPAKEHKVQTTEYQYVTSSS